MKTYLIDLVNTCDMRTGFGFKCEAESEKEALEKMHKQMPGCWAAARITVEGE